MDNRIFNVNGKTKQQLALAVQALLLDEYDGIQKVKGWYFNKERGLVLTWYVGNDSGNKKTIPFTNRMGQPTEIEPDELVDILWDWLSSEQANEVELEGWDKKFEDSDVSNNAGWRLYVDEWGHVKEGNKPHDSIDHYSIAALTKAYMWYGK